jgi:hypothetical protein
LFIVTKECDMSVEKNEEDEWDNVMGPGDLTIEALQHMEDVLNAARKQDQQQHTMKHLNMITSIKPSSIEMVDNKRLFCDTVKQLEEDEFDHVDVDWTEDDLKQVDLISQIWNLTSPSRMLDPAQVQQQGTIAPTFHDTSRIKLTEYALFYELNGDLII